MGALCGGTKPTSPNPIRKSPQDYLSADFPNVTPADFDAYKSEYIKILHNSTSTYLTKDQVVQLFRNLGTEIPAIAISGLILLVDKNKNGRVEFDEYIALMQRLSGGLGIENENRVVYTTKRGGAVTQLQFELYRSYFEFYDKDPPFGKLSFEEYFFSVVSCDNFFRYVESIRGSRVQLEAVGLLEITGCGVEVSDEEVKGFREVFDKMTAAEGGPMELDEYITLQMMQKEGMTSAKKLIEKLTEVELASKLEGD
jgi:Ca2+-binding EF-hand superfamily protein